MKETAPFYAVNEIFYSLQGEGFFTGTPSVFVRFSGCNRRCEFCDTDFSASEAMTVQEITARVAVYPCRRVIFTGGEPLLQVDAPLIAAFKELGYFISVETNGSLPIPDGIDWVTCSPKSPPYRIDRLDELKIVYQGQNPDEAVALFPYTPVRFLQPCSGMNIPETVEYILAHPEWRLSLQTHKLIDIR